eukprot:GFYU01008352.1.p1 GENE.GFYU01008352.1~~GFYU01008352.1.p1  ORF type:complete len:287 (-),score=93.69 GFYU01008352.1:241-1053(-)
MVVVESTNTEQENILASRGVGKNQDKNWTEDEIVQELERLQEKIRSLEKEVKEEVPLVGAENEDEDIDENAIELFEAPPHSIPIRADVRFYDFNRITSKMKFDVIVMDPPWQLASANPTRGVAIGYDQLKDSDIADIPVPQLQTDGFIFIWVINVKYKWAIQQMENWGYAYVDDIAWVKQTVNRRSAKGHGYYLQHAKETCIVGKKGKDPPGFRPSIASDVIFAERRGQSQKPLELYELIEEMVPNGNFIEIFARRNNMRNYWFSMGLEL